MPARGRRSGRAAPEPPWPALDSLKCYASLGHKAGAFPIAEKAGNQCLSLPIFPELTEAQIQRVVAVIKDFFGK